MAQIEAIVLGREELGHGRMLLTLHAPELATRVIPGQCVALQIGASPLEPLLRVPIAISGAEPAGTLRLLFGGDDKVPPHREGDRVDLLGPIGRGWRIDEQTRNILLMGTEAFLGALLFAARVAIARGLSVTLLIGAREGGPALPASLAPPAVEYQFNRGPDAAAAALDLLDDSLLGWADALYTTLGIADYPSIAARVRAGRVRWGPGFAHGLLVPPMACFVGICDVCIVPEARRTWRACVDGPQCDIRDFVR